MTARIYTPDATGRCTVGPRPEAEHSRSGGWEGDEARCMPDPVTDEQLRALYVAATSCPINGDIGHLHSGPSFARDSCSCGRPFPYPGHLVPDAELDRNATIQLTQRALSGEQYARAQCAAAIKARAKGVK